MTGGRKRRAKRVLVRWTRKRVRGRGRRKDWRSRPAVVWEDAPDCGPVIPAYEAWKEKRLHPCKFRHWARRPCSRSSSSFSRGRPTTFERYLSRDAGVRVSRRPDRRMHRGARVYARPFKNQSRIVWTVIGLRAERYSFVDPVTTGLLY